MTVETMMKEGAQRKMKRREEISEEFNKWKTRENFM